MHNYLDYETITAEGKRIYLIGEDKYYPSITTILGQTLPSEKSNILANWRARVGDAAANKISNNACNRGTNLHLMLERALAGLDPQIETFPKEHAALFKSLKLEIRKINKVIGQEVVIYSDILRIAGRCDLICEYQGELAIVDYKTSSRVKSEHEIGDYFLQSAFYLMGHNEMFGTDIKKMVILMGVENKLPMVFKKTIDDDLLMKLVTRVSEFYEKI